LKKIKKEKEKMVRLNKLAFLDVMETRVSNKGVGLGSKLDQ